MPADEKGEVQDFLDRNIGSPNPAASAATAVP
jgi:hypothetical protein